MNRQQKEVLVKELKNDFSDNQSLFLIGYRGLTVAQMQSLRRGLSEKGGSLKVAKVRLMKRAVEAVDKTESLMPYLKGQLAVVYSDKEPPVIAKVLYDFAKENEQLHLIAGCLDAELLTQDGISRIAELPSKEVLYAQLCGTLLAPVTRLASVLNQHGARLLSVLKKIEEQKK